MRQLRRKWRLETLAEGQWFKLTCNPWPRITHFNERVEDALKTFDDVATGDYMVHVMDRDNCINIAVQSEIDALTLQLLLPVSGCYRGPINLRREQRGAIARRANPRSTSSFTYRSS